MEIDSRKPLGRFVYTGPYTKAERDEFIDQLSGIPGTLEAAIHGLTDTQLDTPYRPEGWTLRQLTHHIADTNVIMYIRFRMALTVDRPLVPAFDENRWAELPDAKAGDIETSITLLRGLHARWVALLRTLTDTDYARLLVHPEAGEMTLDRVLGSYTFHSRHHIAQITESRKRHGW